MKKVLLRETAIYAALLLMLALLMHPDLLTDPAERVRLMSEHSNYLHPLLYAGVLYVLIGIIRLLIHFIRRIVRAHKSPNK